MVPNHTKYENNPFIHYGGMCRDGWTDRWSDSQRQTDTDRHRQTDRLIRPVPTFPDSAIAEQGIMSTYFNILKIAAVSCIIVQNVCIYNIVLAQGCT